MNLEVMEFYNSKWIQIFKLPFYMTHILQPLDLIIFAAY